MSLQNVSEPGQVRRTSTSSTGSGRPLPFGHWTLPVSGNCPSCHHHHRSVKVHILPFQSSSEVVDLHCEKCDKLWLAPGRRNITRLSLASVETIDPPPVESEARKALAYAIRSVNRVASLSIAQPDSSNGERSEEIVFRRSVESGSSTGVQLNANESTSGAKFRPRRIIQRLGREGSRPRLPILRRGWFRRRTKEDDTPRLEDTQKEVSLLTDQKELSNPTSYQAKNEQSPGTRTIEKEMSLATTEQEIIQAMTPEQRFALLRAQITALSAQILPDSERPNAGYDEGGAVATIAAIRNTLLTNLGDSFGGYDRRSIGPIDGYQNRNLSTSSDISDRTSEAATIVDGQMFASEDLLREVLHRAVELTSRGRRPSAESMRSNRQGNQGRIESSLDAPQGILSDSARIGTLSKITGKSRRMPVHSSDVESRRHVGLSNRRDPGVQASQSTNVISQYSAGSPITSAVRSESPMDEMRPSSLYSSRKERLSVNRLLELEKESPFNPPVSEVPLGQSDEYQWILTQKLQHHRLSFGNRDTMISIGDQIFDQLHKGLNAREGDKQWSLSTVMFHGRWELQKYINCLPLTFDTPVSEILSKTLCLTGSRLEAQLMSVSDYIQQTWPLTGKILVSLLRNLVTFAEHDRVDRESSILCRIIATHRCA